MGGNWTVTPPHCMSNPVSATLPNVQFEFKDLSDAFNAAGATPVSGLLVPFPFALPANSRGSNYVIPIAAAPLQRSRASSFCRPHGAHWALVLVMPELLAQETLDIFPSHFGRMRTWIIRTYRRHPVLILLTCRLLSTPFPFLRLRSLCAFSTTFPWIHACLRSIVLPAVLGASGVFLNSKRITTAH